MGHRGGFQYNFIRLNLECPWNLYGQLTASYSNNFVLSGAAPLADNEAEPTALDLFEPIKLLSIAGAYLKSFSYYHPNVGTAAVHVEYTPSQHPCTGAGFGTGLNNQTMQQPEVCILCEGPTDKNTRGKQVYLRKYIHYVLSDGTGLTHLPIVGDPLAKWKTGAGPRLLVPIDSDSGTQASTWTVEPHLYTRQFRKGKKRKAPATSVVQEILDAAEKLAPILPLIPK